jgi:hypothetical protein
MIYKILYIIIIDNANMLQHKYKGIAAGTQPENLLNTVISLTHELGYGDLDSPAIAMLNLRRIRAGGVSMSSFYATAVLCSPSVPGRWLPCWMLSRRR